MKKFKKLTAGLLGAVMALSVCSFTALAADLELVNNVQRADRDKIFNNVLFANGKDVTVESADEGNGLIVTVGDNKYTFNKNEATEDGLTIFAGGDNDKTDKNVTITVEDGAKVYTIFGGGHGNSHVGNVEINIKEGAEADAIYGGGLTSYGDGESKAQVDNVDINVDGKVRLIYAGGSSAVGPTIYEVINEKTREINNYVNNATVNIAGDVLYYFGASYSYGGIGNVTCTLSGKLGEGDPEAYSAISGANGFTGSAKMIVKEGAVVNAGLFFCMRGYIMGNVELENYGEIDDLLINPTGEGVSVDGDFTVKNNGTIKNCYIDCDSTKKTLKDEYKYYPEVITLDGDITATKALYMRDNEEKEYKPLDGQTIYLVNGAKLADGETLTNVKVVADTVGETVVTTGTDDATVNTDGVSLPEDFTAETIKDNVEVAGLENNVKDVVTKSDVEKAKDELGVKNDADIEIKVVTYLDIKVENYVNNDTEKTFTVDVTPMYKLEATSGTSTKPIKEGEKLDVTKEVEVTIPVPRGMFNEDNLFVKHIHNVRTYYYKATLNNNNDNDKVTFTNPNGFSLITVFNDNRSGSIKFKNSDGNGIEKKEYNVANIGDKLPDYKEKGYTFKGWVIDGEVYDTFTVELLNLINGETFIATPKLVKNSSKPSHSYSLEEGRVERDNDKEEPVVTTEPEEEAGPFSDVGKDNPNYDAIIKVYENGWMAGIGDGVFAPNGTLTRGMGAMVLWNKAGNPEPQNVAPFLDVTSDDWYAKAVAWAYEQGIVAGYGDVFGPDDALTTEQFERMSAIANGKTPEIYVGGAPNATRGWVASLLAM